MDAAKSLEVRGIGLKEMEAAAFALYVGNRSEAPRRRAKFRRLLTKNLKDPNIALLIEAAIHLDQTLREAGTKVFDGSEDPSALVADELIGMSIAEYIAGKRGLFNYVRYDRKKPGILARLPPFLDDAVGALVAATMTKAFED